MKRLFSAHPFLTLAIPAIGLLLLAVTGAGFLSMAPASRAQTAQPASPAPQPKLKAVEAFPGTFSRIGDEYLALGDSVAFGVGASSPEELGYAGFFFQNYLKLAKPELQVFKNLAIPGETTVSFLSRPSSRSQLQKALDELDSARQTGRLISPITLTIGGNDLLAARGFNEGSKQAVLEKVGTNLKDILAQLSAHKDSKSDLIVTTYYNPFAGADKASPADQRWLEEFNNLLKNLAEASGALVADFYSPMVGREGSLTWISQGDIHPNVAGHAVLAAAIWKAAGYGSIQPAP